MDANIELRTGQLVKLRAFGPETIERKVVGCRGVMVYICREEEYETSIRLGQQPRSIGFHKSDIIQIVESNLD